jgi:adenylosuccinate lyase
VKPIHPPAESIPNVLAERYASAAMQEIWSAHGRILLERDFWIAVMKAQRDLGGSGSANASRSMM